ncbi:uncharacterized protein LOC131996179 [Stomoxys calcitrans]|uniref:uncharacterized protein LOC131996179 n=1 Tax=Stomoxys calcitrans TaxID=35570 RepID=UPI0027E30F69|nr:uncharacterized protein LOC131996179 [Stomoxys calcitrans]
MPVTRSNEDLAGADNFVFPDGVELIGDQVTERAGVSTRSQTRRNERQGRSLSRSINRRESLNVGEQQVRNIVTSSLNEFRSEITTIISNELGNTLRNMNLETNSDNRRQNQTGALLAHTHVQTQNSEKTVNIIRNWRLIYSGSDKDIPVEEFIYRVDRMTQTTLGGQYELLSLNAHMLFEGKALQWFWRYHHLNRIVEWSSLSVALRTQYRDYYNDYDVKDDIRQRRQRANETFDDFYDAMLTLSDKLSTPLSDEEMCEVVMRNLRSEIRHELLHLNFRHVSDLRKAVRKHEKFVRDIQVRKKLYQGRDKLQIAEVEEDLDRDSETEDGAEVCGIKAQLKCWNCDSIGHGYKDCTKERRIFLWCSGKLPNGCPSTEERTSINSTAQIEILQPVLHLPDKTTNQTIQLPSECTNINQEQLGNSRTKRNAIRMRTFWKSLKKLRQYVISSIVTLQADTRPYLPLTVCGQLYFALLDSGANKSVIGGSLVEKVRTLQGFKKYRGVVRTADGQGQEIVGIVNLEFYHQGEMCVFEFLVIPTINQDIICGIDFWKRYNISISAQGANSEIGPENDKAEIENRIELSDIQRKKLEAVIELFPNSDRDGLGRTTLVRHEIDTGDAKPIRQRCYPISPAREKILCGEIDRMISLGVIGECPNSSWSSPGVLLVKPDKVRFCVDSRKLNAVTVRDSYPMPNIEGILSRLPEVHYISKVDLKDAFWQIELTEGSRPKTAFTVPNRPLYQFVRMPFGLCNAPETMCRLMDMVIPYSMTSNIFVYLDDLLIVSTNFQDHLRHLQELAARLRQAGLTINVKKSCFAIKEVKYLGYIVGEGSLSVDPEKVEAISNFPAPTSVRRLRQFLGMIGWYRRFIEDFSTCSYPLTELLSKKRSFVWSKQAQDSFDLLKTKLCSAPVLVNADFSKPFVLQCDASTVGVGAVLAQVDNAGNERPIAFMSQKLNKAQRNYTTTELECLAVVLAVKKFRAYIEGQEFKVVTDHASLKWLMRQTDLSGRLARWALKLQAFDFSIEHRSGKDNVVPDTLSRAFEAENKVAEIDLEVEPAIDMDSEAFDSVEYSKWREDFLRSGIPDYKIDGNHIYRKTKFTRVCDKDEVPLKKLVTKPIVDYLQKEIFDSYGVPEVVVSDNGTQFKCKAFQAFLNKYGVKQQFTAIHSPQANASERVNRSINAALRSYIKDDQGKWDQYLSSINCALRNSVHQTIGMTPYEVVFGQSMITHGEDYNLLWKLKILEDGDSQMPRMDKFSLLRDKIQKKMREAYRKNERTYNLRSRNRKLDIGQEVVRRNFPQSSRIKNFSAKLAPTGVKAIVIRRVGNAYYELRDVSTDLKR